VQDRSYKGVTLIVVGVILIIIGMIFSYVICSEIMPIMPVIFGAILFITSFLIAMAGFAILLLGSLLSQQTLELTIAGRRITKSLNP